MKYEYDFGVQSPELWPFHTRNITLFVLKSCHNWMLIITADPYYGRKPDTNNPISIETFDAVVTNNICIFWIDEIYAYYP